MFVRRRRSQSVTPNPEAPAQEGASARRHHDSLPTIESLGLAPIELAIVDLVRCFCHGYASGNLASWEHAFRLADDRLGLAEGPILAARVSALIRAMRDERQVDFGFMPLGCSRISEDEEALLALIKASCDDGQYETVNVAVKRMRTIPWPERMIVAAMSLSVFSQDCRISSSQQPSACTPGPPRTLN
jgi:hypothetical protein